MPPEPEKVAGLRLRCAAAVAEESNRANTVQRWPAIAFAGWKLPDPSQIRTAPRRCSWSVRHYAPETRQRRHRQSILAERVGAELVGAQQNTGTPVFTNPCRFRAEPWISDARRAPKQTTWSREAMTAEAASIAPRSWGENRMSSPPSAGIVPEWVHEMTAHFSKQALDRREPFDEPRLIRQAHKPASWPWREAGAARPPRFGSAPRPDRMPVDDGCLRTGARCRNKIWLSGPGEGTLAARIRPALLAFLTHQLSRRELPRCAARTAE